MPRALWKGAITFGLVYIPVELYPAEKRDTLDLTMLDRRDLKPVGYQRVNKESGKVVPSDKIVKGYEYKKEQYVVLTDADFRKANIEATRTASIVTFVPADQIPLLYFDTPYYLVPEKRGEKNLRAAARGAEAHRPGGHCLRRDPQPAAPGGADAHGRHAGIEYAAVRL